MDLPQLIDRPELSKKHQVKRYQNLKRLIELLSERDDVSGEIWTSFRERVEVLNDMGSEESKFNSTLRRTYNGMLQELAKKLKLVPKHYYRNMWMGMGMATFGVPIGVAVGTSVGNMGMMGVGISMGFAIGIAVGTGMDKKAEAEGRQLDMEV